MKEVLVFFDAGFLYKVNKVVGNGVYLKFDIYKFSVKISQEQNLFLKHIFYYNAPPHKSDQIKLSKYEKFVNNYFKNKKMFTLREGRLQRLKLKSKCNKCGNLEQQYTYTQKGVDTLLTMDLMNFNYVYSKIKKIILITSDSDFVPIIEYLKSIGIEVILYTFFGRNRKSFFSNKSPELLRAVSKYVLVEKKHFINS